MGNLRGKAFPGVGNMTFAMVEWEKLETEVSCFKRFFFLGGGELTAITTCWDKMEEFKERDMAFVSDWLTKKRSSKAV